jgi:anti-sigma28 factor (negative regulator of flagellin synthesis)
MDKSIAQIAEERIREAIDNGEFDNLPGKGKPLDLSDLANVPPHLRMQYKILKNAGLLPEEVTLKQEIAALEKVLETCGEQDKRETLKQQIRDKTLYYNILMERRRHR